MHWMLEAFLSAFITILVFIWMNNRSFIIMRLLVCLVASWGVALWAIKMGSAVLTFWFFHVYRKGALEDATITMIRGSEIIVGTIAATSLAFLLDAFRKQKQSSDY